MARRQTRNQTAEVATEEPTETVTREPFPKRRSWSHDNVAGVEQASYSDRDKKIYQTWIQFRDGKPSQEVRQIMKDAGYRWENEVPPGGSFDATGAWVRDNKGPDLAADRAMGERTYKKVVDQIYTEKGIEREPEGRTPF